MSRKACFLPCKCRHILFGRGVLAHFRPSHSSMIYRFSKLKPLFTIPQIHYFELGETKLNLTFYEGPTNK